MAKPLLPDARWDRIDPLLPPPPKRLWPDRPGRRPHNSLSGILFVKIGIDVEGDDPPGAVRPGQLDDLLQEAARRPTL